MECLVVPYSVLMRRCSGKYSASRLGYRPLAEDAMVADGDLVTVVVGKERKQFLVNSYVLQEIPFRVLIDLAMKDYYHNNNNDQKDNKRVIYVDVDAILFEHMLWLMYNDCSSFLKLNVKEIMDFYAQDY